MNNITREAHKVWNRHNPNNKIESEQNCGSGKHKFVIHHKDGNRKNNHISNLRKMTHKKHISLHQKGKVTSQARSKG